MKCPCCGNPVSPADTLLVSLVTNRIFFEGGVAQVTGKCAELALVLSDAMPLPVDKDRLVSRLWGIREPASDPYVALRVYASKLRKQVKPLGLTIENSRREGYRMVRLGPSERMAAA